MFGIYRQKRSFVVSQVDQQLNVVVVEDLLSGLRIEIPYGSGDLVGAEFIEEYVLHLVFADRTEKSINLLMQGY